MRVMRSNYDKPWRCPNWSGPALKAGDGPCPSGSGARMFSLYGRSAKWRFWLCRECGTLVLPAILRLLDPSWWAYCINWKIGDWRYERSHR